MYLDQHREAFSVLGKSTSNVQIGDKIEFRSISYGKPLVCKSIAKSGTCGIFRVDGHMTWSGRGMTQRYVPTTYYKIIFNDLVKGFATVVEEQRFGRDRKAAKEYIKSV